MIAQYGVCRQSQVLSELTWAAVKAGLMGLEDCGDTGNTGTEVGKIGADDSIGVSYMISPSARPA